MKIVAGKKEKYEHDYMLIEKEKVLMQINFTTSVIKNNRLKLKEKKIIIDYIKQGVEEIKRLRNKENEPTDLRNNI